MGDPYNCAEPGRIDQLRAGRDAFWRRLDEVARRVHGLPPWKIDSVRAWEAQARGKETPMGYYTTVTGSFEIVPPLKGKEMSGFTEEDIPYGLSGEIIETHKEVDDGTLVIRSLEHIYADGDSFKAYTFENDLQAMVSRFPGHKWVGRVQGEGEEQGDMWRLYIRDGKVIRHEVKNMWPEAPPED